MDKVECLSCGESPETIMALHEYDIRYDEEQKQWVKDYGQVTYRCGLCGEEIEPQEIKDILKQVDEL